MTGGETGDLLRSVIRWLVAVAVWALLTGAACGRDDETATTTSTTGSTSRRPPPPPTIGRLTQSCMHEEREVRIVVHYPEGWHTNGDAGVVPCSAFDPDPFQRRPGTELPPELAIVLRVEPADFERASAAGRVEDESTMTVDGRGAVHQEAVATGMGLEPAEQRSVRYVIDGDAGRSIIVTTSDVEGNDFSVTRSVLDAMVSAFDIDPRNEA